MEEPRLIQEDKCDTPALSFFLPQSLPELAAELDVELLVRFTEVRKKGKMKIMSYRAAEIVGKSNVTGFKLTQLPDLTDVKKYRIEVMLSVNGTMSSNWSSAEGTLAAIQHCECCSMNLSLWKHCSCIPLCCSYYFCLLLTRPSHRDN